MPRTSVSLIALPLVIAVAVAGCGRLSFNPYTAGRAQAQHNLNDLVAQAQRQGFTTVWGPHAGQSEIGAPVTIPGVEVRAGMQYVLFGACEDDCTDLDLTLVNDRGVVVYEDTSPEAIAEIRFNARASARLSVRVTIAACRTRPCMFAVQMGERTPR